MIEKCINELNSYHKESAEHSLRAAKLGEQLATSFFNQEEVLLIKEALIVHDYGKKFISVDLLNKKGILSLEEKYEINKHSILGANALREMGFSRDIIFLVENHHNKNLKDMPDILIFVQIIDIFDALISPRIYKEAFSLEKTIFIIEKEFEGIPFSSTVIEQLLNIKHSKA